MHLQALAQSGFHISWRGLGGNVLWVDVKGIHTRASLAQDRAEAWRNVVRSADVFVTDYSQALILIDADGVAAMTSRGVIPYPGAFLVNDAQLPTFTEYADRINERGITRRVFVSPQQALDWAMARARLSRLAHPHRSKAPSAVGEPAALPPGG